MKKARAYCLFCNSPGKLCLFYYTQTYFCYKCRAWGQIKDLPEEYQGKKYLRTNKFKHGDNDSEELKLPPGFRPLEIGSIGWNYLVSRNIKVLPLMSFVGVANRYIYFPSYDGGKLIYYTGRKMYGSGLRYKMPKSSGGDEIFVPYQMSFDNTDLVLCEGVFDCLRVYQSTGIACIALYGKEINSGKIMRILKYSSQRVHILLDPPRKDPDTPRAAIEIGNKLRGLRYTDVITYESEKDPGDLNDREIKEVLSSIL